MKYEEMPPIQRDLATVELASGDPERVSRALVQLAFHESDRVWLEDVIAAHLSAPDPWIRGLAATCAGHVARIHRDLDVVRLVPLIERLGDDPDTVGRMEDALDDIAMFVRNPGRS